MGYMCHHAMIVTCYDLDRLKIAHSKAMSVFPHVSDIVMSEINGYVSFFIPPDGSKEGWVTSDEGDARRQWFGEWLDEQRFEDHSTWLKWVEVQYGDDEGITAIIQDDERPIRRQEAG